MFSYSKKRSLDTKNCLLRTKNVYLLQKIFTCNKNLFVYNKKYLLDAKIVYLRQKTIYSE